MTPDPVTQLAAAIAAVARFIPALLFGVLVASVVVAIWGDGFKNPEAARLAFFAGGALLWYLGEEGLKKWRKQREKAAAERAAAEKKAAAELAAAEESAAAEAAAFNKLPSDAQKLLLLTRLAGDTRLTVDVPGTIHGALLTCPLVQRVGPIKGNVQGYSWGDYYQYDLLDVGVERVDALLAKLKEEDPTTYAELERRANARR